MLYWDKQLADDNHDYIEYTSNVDCSKAWILLPPMMIVFLCVSYISLEQIKLTNKYVDKNNYNYGYVTRVSYVVGP